MNRAYSLSSVLGVVAVLAAGTCVPAAFADTSSLASQAGVWQKHQYRFQFLGFTTTYSCDGLADKLALLLKYSGARSDAKAFPGACSTGLGRPDKFASADLTFYTLTPPSGTANEVEVPATWRAVALQTRKPQELGEGDCELIEQFRSALLPMFTTRNVDDRTTCIPHQQSSGSIALTFDSLAPVPPPPKIK